ncbi:tRNA dimethylallyltransferase 2 [Asparagus officinalis]|uniref:tRNA dimethylallyltransferase 2 n=1 Tax=Asparagus officinalis TaxID=4686 RepID=A0A5P1EDK5_ASPOF|nr:tRNA dimethylallyltransferase 2 [Asparagus officinalis]
MADLRGSRIWGGGAWGLELEVAAGIIDDILSRDGLPVIVGGTDYYIQIIDDILSRDGLPVIVGGTDYYIQALVLRSFWKFLFLAELSNVDLAASYERLKEIDPVAANRIHPNDHRKIILVGASSNS